MLDKAAINRKTTNVPNVNMNKDIELFDQIPTDYFRS